MFVSEGAAPKCSDGIKQLNSPFRCNVLVRECNKWVYVFPFEFLLAYTTNNQLVKFSSDNGVTFNDISFAAGVWNYSDDLNEHAYKKSNKRR